MSTSELPSPKTSTVPLPAEKLVFVFNALHRIEDVDQATNILAAVLDGRFAERPFYFSGQKNSLSTGEALAARTG